MARKPPPPPPEYVRHTGRPVWGIGVLVGEADGTKTYLFADGGKRAFKADLVAQFIVPAEPPKEEDKERIARGLASNGAATPKAINLELEAQIRAQPDDPAAYLVYADWLQQRDDPRGALIPIHAQLTPDPTNRKLRAAEKALLEEHGAYLLPPNLHAMLRVPQRKTEVPRSRCEVVWRFGFLDEVHLAKRPRPGGEEDEDREIPALTGELLRHPSAHFLRRLSIGSLGTTKEYSYIASIAEIAKARHPLLREIVIGDFDPAMMELAFSRIGTASQLLVPDATPSLERLTLRAGSLRFDAAIKHPRLKELRIIVVEITAAALNRIFTSELPALELLELSCPRPAIPPSAVLAMVRRQPKLKRLIVRQAVRNPALNAALRAAPDIVGRVELDLDDGDVRRGAGPLLDAEVVARAPDARSVAAARAIAKPMEWLVLARAGRRVWGELEGSDHYYVLAGLDDPRETSCTCASAKNPCKHVLALLFLAAAQHPFEERPVPLTLAIQTRDRPDYRAR